MYKRQEALDDASRDKMVHTIAFPKAGATLPEKLANLQLVSFSPGTAGDLKAITAECGEPDHSETWEYAAKNLDMAGKTHWWGRFGLAVDEKEAITWMFVRAYPSDKKL